MTDLKKYLEAKQEMLKFIYKHQLGIGKELAYELMLRLNRDAIIKGEALPTVLEMELYSKFEILPKWLDTYKFAYQMLKEEGFLTGNLLEIASGPYPRLSEIIKENLGEKVNLTAYDPRLVLETMDGVTLKKKEFSRDIKIKNIDTIFGLFPCNATIPLLDQGFKENANIFLAFCGCNHSSDEHPLWFGSTWAEDVIDDYMEMYPDEITIKRWPKEAKISHPILIRKRK